jgi:hypothetical protein
MTINNQIWGFSPDMGDLGDTLAGGITSYMDSRRIANVMKEADGDYMKAAQLLLEAGDTKGAAAISEIYDSQQGSEGRFGLSPVLGEGPNGELQYFQSNSGGGASPMELPGGYKPAPPNRWFEGADGRPFAVPSRGSGASPAPTTNVTPGSPQPGGQPGQYPQTLRGKKQGHDMAQNAVSDSNVINSFDDQIAHYSANLKRIMTPEGGPSEAFKNVAGTEKIGGFDTGIPKSLTAWSEKSREQLSTLKSMQVQQGLNILKGMRADSAQGASGMGQLAIQESQWLQQAITSLQEANSPEEIIERAKDVEYYMGLVSQRLREGYREIYGNDPSPSESRGGIPPSQQAPSPSRKVYDLDGNPVE